MSDKPWKEELMKVLLDQDLVDEVERRLEKSIQASLGLIDDESWFPRCDFPIPDNVCNPFEHQFDVDRSVVLDTWPPMYVGACKVCGLQVYIKRHQ